MLIHTVRRYLKDMALALAEKPKQIWTWKKTNHSYSQGKVRSCHFQVCWTIHDGHSYVSISQYSVLWTLVEGAL